MSWALDAGEFNPASISSWISLLNFIPRFPYLYIADAITSAFIVRSSTTIGNPLVSFVLGLLVATFSDNCDAIFNNRKLATFEQPLLVPIFAAAWLAFNFCPFDLVLKISTFLTPLGAFASAFLAGRDLTRGVDLGVTYYPTNWIPVILTGVVFGAGKYILLHAYSAFYRQRARSAGPIIFGITAAALSYYWFTDLGHLSNTLWFDKEEARFAVLVGLSIFGVVRSLVADSAFTASYDWLGAVIGAVVPYYGATWAPRSVEIVRHRPVSEAPPSSEKTKVKTD
jgi:hypothetical protein